MRKRLIWMAPAGDPGDGDLHRLDRRRSGDAFCGTGWRRRCSDCGKLPSGRLSDCWLSAGFCSEALVLVVVGIAIRAGEWRGEYASECASEWLSAGSR